MDKVDFLADLQSYEKQNVCDALEPRSFQAGQVVMHQGDAGDGMYFVEAGEVVCMRAEAGDKPDDAKEIARIGPGAHVGELALLKNEPRAATVKAVG